MPRGNKINMPETLVPYAIISLAALVHASFQLSISMLTLISANAIGSKKSHAKQMRLIGGFLLGACLMTLLLLSTVSLLVSRVAGDEVPELAWAITCGMLFGLGLSVWIFYYRREKGTTLWVPRSLARFLSQRTKATKQSAEAFSLGMTSIVAELLFIGVPLFVVALVLVELEPMMQLAGLGLYAVISLSTLIIVAALIGAGKKVSSIQRWRESNKLFLQFAAGSGLIILGLYLYSVQIVDSIFIGVG